MPTFAWTQLGRKNKGHLYVKQIYCSTVISRVVWPLGPALTNNSIIIILKNTHTSKLQAGTKQRYFIGEDTRQSNDQTRYQADTNSVSCIPRVHCYLLRSRDRLRVLQHRLSNFHNSYTFVSQPWALCMNRPRRDSCASVQFQTWWPVRMCFHCRVSISNLCWCWMLQFCRLG